MRTSRRTRRRRRRRRRRRNGSGLAEGVKGIFMIPASFCAQPQGLGSRNLQNSILSYVFQDAPEPCIALREVSHLAWHQSKR
jgi:hypothetical protein